MDAKFAPGPALASLTNVAVYRDPAPTAPPAPRDAAGLPDLYRLGRYRVDVWRPVLQALEAAGDTVDPARRALRFSGVSPQATNLALNTVEELRTDWVNLLLGGENSRWSNFELAEALARLLTGRAVQGVLADAVGTGGIPGAGEVATSGPHPVLPDAALHPGARRRVLHALELAAAPGGTAGALGPAVERLRSRLELLAPGWDLYVMAKTGTPAVEKLVSSAQQQLVQRLHGQGALRWDAASGRILLDPARAAEVRSTLGEAALTWLEDDVFGPIEAEPDSYRARPGEPLPRHPLYLTPAGVLAARELADLRVDRQGSVLLLGLLAVPPDIGRSASAAVEDWVSACVLDPGLRRRILAIPPSETLDGDRAVGLTVAVYLDDLAAGEGTGAAVALADQALGPVSDHLLREVGRRVRRP